MPRALGIFIICVALLGVGSFFAAFAYFKAEELAKAEARLTLYRSTVGAAMQHYSHLPFLLSLDPVVIGTLNGGEPDVLNRRLARLAQSAGVDAIYLMDAEGMTISASNARLASSFVGQNYAYRPYFTEALRGELGEFYGIGATTGIPGYFYAMAVRTEQSKITGVIAIKLDLSGLQDGWQASGERIILSNADGIVLLASEPGWRYRTLRPLTEPQWGRIREARQFANEPLEMLNWAPDLESDTATIDGKQFLYLQTGDLPNSWSLHFFAPDDGAATRAWLATAVIMLLSGVFLVTWQVQRVRQIGGALARSEREEANLRVANDQLANEIEERRRAERRLQKTKQELERAGRLAALGQLASSVTHELGQPIAAMRNQIVAEEMSSGASPFKDKMHGLVARMEDITRQLKFFSRKGRDKFEAVDLRGIITDALELLEPNIKAADAQVSVQMPSHMVTLNGNKLRLEQVMTNLVRNALDAVEGREVRQIEVVLGQADSLVWVEVRDTGHGLQGKSLPELREPFATSRESGKGMGLGLTISAGIVADHGGQMSAADRDPSGAIFRAEFGLSTTEEVL